MESGAPDFEKVLRGGDAKMRLEPGGCRRLDVQFRKTKTDQHAFARARGHGPVADGARGLCVVDAIARLQRAFPEPVEGRRPGTA